jgi:gamma-glutamyltranspeptidase / glutathione hydrolase
MNSAKRLKIYTIIALLLVSSVAQYSIYGQTETSKTAVSKESMATTAHPLATEAAIQMLRKGGNAVDAAVAAAFAIGVVEPDGSGIGGGGGMVIYMADQKKSIYINYYQRASENIEGLSYDPSSDNRSPKAILIPGTVAGLIEALEHFGTLPLSVILGPSIGYAENGFPLDETLAKILLDNTDFIQKDSALASIFLRDGFPLMQGDTLRQVELSNTLRAIAANGRSGFYEGPIAEAVVNEVTRKGGMLTLNDLKNYHAVVTEPLHGTYRGYEIITAAAPQSGSSILEGLNILENANLKSMGHYSESAETMHLMAETIRRVYADRTAFLDDPKFENVPVSGMISKRYAKTRYDDIDRSEVSPSDYRKTKAGNPMTYTDLSDQNNQKPLKESVDKNFQWDDVDEEGVSTYKRTDDDLFGRWGTRNKQRNDHAEEDTTGKGSEDHPKNDDTDPPEAENVTPSIPLQYTRTDSTSLLQFDSQEGGHTTHLSVIDRSGNAVSLTQTLGTFFGSGLSAAGVIMNCGMANFSITTAINSVKANKQPRSSIAPTIVLKDDIPYLTVGSPGASRIVATVIELLVNVLDFGMSVEEANNAPRFICQKNDDYLSLESRISEYVQDGLKKKGHRLKLYGDMDLFFGGAQMILYDRQTRTYYGSADPRRGGVAIGD